MKTEGTDFIQTTFARRALEMGHNVMAAGRSRRCGQIVGNPGTGKTEAAEWLAAQMGGAYVAAWQSVSVNGLLLAVARALGDTRLKDNTANDRVFSVLRELVTGRLIVVDEANLLNWKHLEALRTLPDQSGAGLVLVGTLLFDEYLHASKAQTLVAQLTSRIGTKSVRFEAMSLRETAAAIIKPRYADANAEASKAFHDLCGGRWRDAVELAETCDRIMTVNNVAFGLDVVQSAAAA
ncbi:MAG: ATP-binding protein, partial [Magnetospirillum sp.]|nr:ATP-binding protein [Magnetospirillum sp.]